MAHSPRTIRIVSASLVAVLMVGGSYVFSGPVPFFDTERVSAENSAQLLREYAVKDTDRDNLPDWQEALYGTDPENPESFRAGVLDGDAVAQGLIQPKVAVAPAPSTTDPETIPGIKAAPASLTDRFAQTFLTQYLQGRGDTPPTNAEIVAFVEAGVADLSANTAPADSFTTSDLRASGTSGTAALTTYAIQVEAAFGAHTTPTSQNELEYFADALKDDASALKKIAEIRDAYADIADAVIEIPVPTEARQAHLAIANALMYMHAVNADMATMKTDPLRALMGIGLYRDYADRLVASFAQLNTVLVSRQVSIPLGEPGSGLLYIANAAAQTAAESAAQ